MGTFQELQNIFYSGAYSFSGSLDPISEFAFLIREGYMNLKTITIADKVEYLTLFENKNVIRRAFNAAGGGDAHIALKLSGGKYLEKSTGRSVLYEHPFCGYFPDIMSADHSVIIECGHTQNPEKVFKYFQEGVKEFIQIPYTNETDTKITGYSFSPNEHLIEFLKLLEQTKLDETRKNIQ